MFNVIKNLFKKNRKIVANVSKADIHRVSVNRTKVNKIEVSRFEPKRFEMKKFEPKKFEPEEFDPTVFTFRHTVTGEIRKVRYDDDKSFDKCMGNKDMQLIFM